MKKSFYVFISLVITLFLVVGCTTNPAPVNNPETTAANSSQTVNLSENGNFTLLISDEPNDIGDFFSLWVTITGIGFQNAEGEWVDNNDLNETVNLVDLQGDNASEICGLELAADTYQKIFVYVAEVKGYYTEADEDKGDSVGVKLPSGKLQMNKSFEVAEDGNVEFVFDITVNKTGNGKYILKPQIGESGADKEFKNVTKEKAGDSTKIKDSKFFGTVKSYDTNDNSCTVTVDSNDYNVIIDEETKVEGVLEAEAKVMIKGILDEKQANTIIASMIVAQDDEEDNEEVEEQVFEGIITSMDGKSWRVQIGNETKTVDVSNASIEGNPAVELEVKIEGTLSENTITATKVEVKEANEEEEADEQEFEGVFNSVDQSNPNIWIVSITVNKNKTQDFNVDVSGISGIVAPDSGAKITITGTLDEESKTITASNIEIVTVESGS